MSRRKHRRRQLRRRQLLWQVGDDATADQLALAIGVLRDLALWLEDVLDEWHGDREEALREEARRRRDPAASEHPDIPF